MEGVIEDLDRWGERVATQVCSVHLDIPCTCTCTCLFNNIYLYINITIQLPCTFILRFTCTLICILGLTGPAFAYQDETAHSPCLIECVFPLPTPDILVALCRCGNWVRNVRPTLPTCTRQMHGDTGLTNWSPVQVMCCTLTMQYYPSTVLSTPDSRNWDLLNIY